MKKLTKSWEIWNLFGDIICHCVSETISIDCLVDHWIKQKIPPRLWNFERYWVSGMPIDVLTWQHIVVHVQHYRKPSMFNKWTGPKRKVQKLGFPVKINSTAFGGVIRREVLWHFFLNMLSWVIRGILVC